MKMLPQNPLSAIQNPSTPTLSHAIASPVHQQPPHPSALSHSSSSFGLVSPPPTPSTPSISGANRPDFGPRTFVPRAAAKLTIPETPKRRPARIRMETEDQRKSRLADQEQNDKLKAEAADKEKKEKEKLEAERKAKVAEEVEVRNLEKAARLEKEQKELRRKQEEKARREAEVLELQRLEEEEERKLKLKQEEERILKTKREEEKALRLGQERAKRTKRKKEQEERERLSKLAEEARLRLEEEAAKAKAEAISISEPEPEEREEGELEAQKGYEKQDGQLEDGKDIDTETSKSMENGKDIPEDGLRIVEKSMMIHLAEDRATTSRNRAISLIQEQEDGLTTNQKIAMISCFMEDVVAADTYILLTDPEVRQGWILMMLMK